MVYFAFAVAAAGSVARSAAVMMSAISSISPVPKPSVVSAGVPSRTPEVYQAPLVSRGTLLRLVTTPASSSAASACRPVSPKLAATSISTMWLLVPPVTRRGARRRSPSGRAWGVAGRGDRDRLGRHHGRQRPAEDHGAALVHERRVLVSAQHEPAARSAQRL